MKLSWKPLVAACWLAFGAAGAQAPGDIRIALVVGNGAYQGAAALPNPANDAKAMSETLRGLGFEVMEVRDADRARMVEAVGKLREALHGKQGIGMLYYAGHALQVDWRNYLVPVDAKLASAADVPPQTLEVGAVLESFRQASTRMNILVLDACRDNPFGQAATGKGLAQVDAPPGTILAYATAPGNVASDGTGSHGLYTGFLLQELVKPQSRIEDVFKRTRFAVRKASKGRQIPWESTSLEEDFMFNAGKVVAAPKPEPSQRAVAFDEEKAEFSRIEASKNADDFFAFLARFPSGNYSELAQVRLEALQRTPLVVQPVQGAKVQANFLTRYRDGDKYTFQFKDGLTGVVRNTTELVLKRTGEDEFLFEAPGVPTTRVNSAGFVLQDGSGRFDPPWVSVPASEFQVGRKVSARAVHTDPRGRKQWADFESRIVARETISTPLGTIDTYKVEVDLSFESGLRRRVTLWFDPDWGAAVRQIVEIRSPRGGAPEIIHREMLARARAS